MSENDLNSAHQDETEIDEIPTTDTPRRKLNRKFIAAAAVAGVVTIVVIAKNLKSDENIDN